MEGLNIGILQKIFAQLTIPKTIGEWDEQASQYDAQYRRVREILNRRRGVSTTTQTKRTFTTPRFTRDPNAMDIDRMTIEERNKHMKENRCFNCHKIGHRAKDCQQKGSNNPSKSTITDEPKQNNERALIKYEGKKTPNTA